MSKALYLPFDTETSGLGREAAILTAHFAACDASFNVIDELELVTKPNSGDYLVTPRAMEVNKINLIEHDKIALTYSQAGGKLRDFIWKYSENGATKLIPVGKNIGFDVIKVTDNYLGAKTWNQYVSYRLYDITGLVIYLKRIGKLQEDAPDSLEGLANFFNIPIVAHTAHGDNIAGIEVVKKLESL
jgi:hypothetical protein